MNLNRPLGDGRDDDGNNVVDEPMPTHTQIKAGTTSGESASEGNLPSSSNWFWLKAFGATAWPASDVFNLTNGMNVTGPDTSGNTTMGLKDQVLARQLMARHLYMLARLMIDDAALTNANWFTEASVTSNPAQKKELAIRRIAQWAINVVDNACPDNIMTPFEYDLYPFNAKDPTTGTPKDPAHPDRTWCVDGIIDDGNGNLSADDNKSWRGLVWGCKSPALLITETLAFHDRRVADTPTSHTREDTAPNTDLDLDQVRIPEGSLFVELFATHNQNNPQQSGDLYTYQSNAVTGKSEWVLDLSKMAPAGSDGNTANIAYPVWRLAISAPQVGTPASPHTTLSSSPGGLPSNAPGYLATFPDSASLDLQQYTIDTNHAITTPDTNNGSLLKSPSQPFDVQLERIVWFSGTTPTTQLGYGGNNSDIFYARQYFNKYYNGKAYLSPGGYAVVGPREVTAIGSYPSTDFAGGPKMGLPVAAAHQSELPIGNQRRDF